MLVFDTIVKRVVGFSQQAYDKNKNQVLDFFDKNKKFQLSVLSSSRSLYNDAKKNKTDKVTDSLEKYFIRAHFNSIPFGIFSHVGILNWGETTQIKKSESLHLTVKYDNSFVSTKIDETILEDCLRLTYFANPSIHFLNTDKIGFYKSKILPNSKVEMSYVEVDFDDDLQVLVSKFEKGSKLSTVIEQLTADGFEKTDIEVYLLEIIDIGLIINDFLFSPLNNKIITSNSLYTSLLIEKGNHKLNSESEIVDFSKQFLIEQDLHFEYNNSQKSSHSIDAFETELGTLNNNVQEKIIKFINFSIQYSSENKPINEHLSKFGSKIANRYNDGFVALNEIFNPYSGLKYSEITTESETILHQDIIAKILASTEKTLFLNFKNSDTKKANLPPTFSVLFESLKCNTTDKEIIFFKGIGGTSAINMISRFEKVTQPLCEQIAQFEKEVHKNKIIAEVNCTGNLQTLNITPTQHYFEHSIPINTVNRGNTATIFFLTYMLTLEEATLL